MISMLLANCGESSPLILSVALMSVTPSQMQFVEHLTFSISSAVEEHTQCTTDNLQICEVTKVDSNDR